MPISREPITVSRRSSVSPRAMSEPAKPMNWPGVAARRTSIAVPSGVATASVCSIITTASAPRGIGPPVAIGVAVPPATARRGATPQAITSGLRASVAGALAPTLARSAARTAKPSTLERSKGGTSSGAAMSSETTRPSASASGTVSLPSGRGRSAASKRRDRFVPGQHGEELLLGDGGEEGA